MKTISKLGIGPMSEEIIEAAFLYSETNSVPLMLISSKNQIDWDAGYVNNWNTKQYSSYVAEMKKKYPKAQIFVCRDHCGPGFKNDDLTDVYKTIDADLSSGFDLIHEITSANE
jgi:tagatose-1,6-bisphosphate aldolase non-catalytic subunit AgaZ/GatZ